MFGFPEWPTGMHLVHIVARFILQQNRRGEVRTILAITHIGKYYQGKTFVTRRMLKWSIASLYGSEDIAGCLSTQALGLCFENVYRISVLCLCGGLVIKPCTRHILGKCCATELHPQPLDG